MKNSEQTFIGRLLAEIVNIEGGIPAATAEIGIDPRIINDLVNGDLLSPQELYAIYAWLTRRITLTRQEVQDFEKLRMANSIRKKVELERAASPGSVMSGATGNRYIPSPPQMVGGLVIVVLAVMVSVAVTATAMKTKNGGTTAGRVASPPAEPSSPIPSPMPMNSSDAAATPSPSAPLSAPAAPQEIITFQSNYISIADMGSYGGPYFKDLSVNPPITTTDQRKGDSHIIIGSYSLTLTILGDNGSTIGMWHQSTTPTRAQCLQAAEAAGVESISINPGQTVCVQTPSGAVASLKLMSIDGSASANFSGTIWYPAKTS
jgi:hypothetical protein